MKKAKCKNCTNHKFAWCSIIADSPDPELLRDCQHFQSKYKNGSVGRGSTARAEKS